MDVPLATAFLTTAVLLELNVRTCAGWPPPIRPGAVTISRVARAATEPLRTTPVLYQTRRRRRMRAVGDSTSQYVITASQRATPTSSRFSHHVKFRPTTAGTSTSTGQCQRYQPEETVPTEPSGRR